MKIEIFDHRGPFGIAVYLNQSSINRIYKETDYWHLSQISEAIEHWCSINSIEYDTIDFLQFTDDGYPVLFNKLDDAIAFKLAWA